LLDDLTLKNLHGSSEIRRLAAVYSAAG